MPAGHVRYQWIGATLGTAVAHVLVPRDLLRLVAAELEGKQ